MAIRYASTMVPGRMTFWSIADDGEYIAIETFQAWEAGPKDVPFSYALRFGTLEKGLEAYFDKYYTIAAEDFQTQLEFVKKFFSKLAH